MIRILLASLLLSMPLHAAIITLYPSSDTYVYESYTVSLLGTEKGLISTLPRNISPVEISAPGLIGANFFPEFQEDYFLKTRIGATVRLAKQAPNESSYLFKGVSGSNYILQRQDEVILLPKDTPLIFEKADFLHTGSLLLHFAKKATPTVQLGYFTPSITSEIRYRLNYEPKTTKGMLTSEVWIDNQSERTFSDSTLTVKVGSSPRDNVQPHRSMQLYAADTRLSKERQLDEGEIVYELATPVSLPPGTTTTVPFMPEKGISVSTLYKVEFGGTQESFIPLNRILRFRNTTGKALAAGDVYCVTDGILQRISRIPVTLQDQMVEVDNGKAFALLGRKTSGPLQKSDNAPESETKTASSITVRNEGSLTVEIEVRDYVPMTMSILDSSHPYSRISKHQVLFKLILEAGRESNISYTTLAKQK
jgi:hypothetical protein